MCEDENPLTRPQRKDFAGAAAAVRNSFPAVEDASSRTRVQSYDIDGAPVVVKNTFLEVEDVTATSSFSHNRCRSSPGKVFGNLPRLSEFSYFVNPFYGSSPIELPSPVTSPLPSEPQVSAPRLEVPSASTSETVSEISEEKAVQKCPLNDDSGMQLADHSSTSASSSHRGACGIGPASDPTTVMLRNLPAGSTRDGLAALFDREGFNAAYNFVYLPVDIASEVPFEYCFLSLVSPSEARRFFQHFDGFSRWPSPSRKEAGVHWSESLHGLDQLIERYRNSPLMHASVSDALKPAIYHDGIRVAFPPPTVKVKPPRVRCKALRQEKRGPIPSADGEVHARTHGDQAT